MSRSFSEEDFTCPACRDIFINPVLLSCSHSFCSNCIQRFWENKTFKECPVCRTRSSNSRPPVNLALKNLCESFLQESIQKPSSEAETVCSVHKEKLKLFCLDDQQLVCLVCRDSRKHANHRFLPVDEAAVDNKEKFKDALTPLQEKLKTFEKFKQSYNKTAEKIKINAEYTEKQIKQGFEELHQFLYDEEAFRLTALRKEEEQNSQKIEEKIEEMSKQISSLTSKIRDIEEQMKTEDDPFLQNFKTKFIRAHYCLPVPDLSPSVTTTFTDHLTNLKLNVLQKMQDNLGKNFCPDSNIVLAQIRPTSGTLGGIHTSYQMWTGSGPTCCCLGDDSEDEYKLYYHFPIGGGDSRKKNKRGLQKLAKSEDPLLAQAKVLLSSRPTKPIGSQPKYPIPLRKYNPSPVYTLAGQCKPELSTDRLIALDLYSTDLKPSTLRLHRSRNSLAFH